MARTAPTSRSSYRRPTGSRPTTRSVSSSQASPVASSTPAATSTPPFTPEFGSRDAGRHSAPLFTDPDDTPPEDVPPVDPPRRQEVIRPCAFHLSSHPRRGYTAPAFMWQGMFDRRTVGFLLYSLLTFPSAGSSPPHHCLP